MLTDKRIWHYECDYSARSFKKKIIVSREYTTSKHMNMSIIVGDVAKNSYLAVLHDMFFKDVFVIKIFTSNVIYMV